MRGIGVRRDRGVEEQGIGVRRVGDSIGLRFIYNQNSKGGHERFTKGTPRRSATSATEVALELVKRVNISSI